MKTKHILTTLFFAFTLIFHGCSSDSSDDGGGNQLTSISLTSDTAGVVVGGTFTFTVTGNNNEALTSTATISVNGSAITGNTFTPTTGGDYTVVAAYDGLTSNTLVVNAVPEITSITLSATSSLSNVYVGDNIMFNVIANNGQDVGSSSTITVDGVDLGGNSYAATAVGTFQFEATYDGLTSNTVEVVVQPAPTKFTKKVLLEDYTGTWCGYCPRVAYGIELVQNDTDNAVPVAIHRGSTNPSSGSYDPYNYNAGTLEDMINLQGYPTAMLNRTIEWNYPEPNNVSQVVNLTSGDANLGLALTPTLNGGNISIDVNVKFGGLFSSDNIKLVVYVLEDDLFYDQTNYTSYYGGASTLANFEHDHVLRASLTSLLGDTIPSSEIVADNVYTNTISVAVPSNVSNTDKMSVVAFVVDGTTNTVYNVRSAHFGDDQAFEEL
ncbi:Omp28-related outer membrane protein [Pontimicrobium sp. IMCC45349]|uniref:Omp28-related outer membrane protein n=1 Tax=Pontimicrobium sp. IMCC45349 TaxID=3391574 RepID=UPI0039A0388F